MAKIKGSVLLSRLDFVKEHAGQGGLERVLARLTAEDRQALGSTLAAKWYEFAVGKRLDQAVVDELGGGRPDYFLKLGAASAERNLRGVHRAFLVEGDPAAFLARTPMIYSFYYDKGRRAYTPVGPREGVLTTYDADTFSAADCLTVVGWHVRALEMCGARDVRVVEEECRAKGGEVCRYRVSWS